jgi:predicted N-acetyltransferase YhbS
LDERLDVRRHDGSQFSCGVSSFDQWLMEDAAADARLSGSRVHVAVADEAVVGCYRLSALEVQRAQGSALRDADRQAVPAVLLSHLGVDAKWQRRGLGSALLVHAIGCSRRSLPRPMCSYS